MMPPPLARVRVLRIIARMNVGGPAYHVSILSGRLDPSRYSTLLITGSLGAGEGSLEGLADRYGVHRKTVDGLAPELRPLADLRALRSLVGVMRRWRPHIVHTHTAKAGTLGRVAARIALGPRPIVVHTYHGHVLSGYFGPAKTAVFSSIERILALTSDRLVGVSQATVDELVKLGVAPARRFAVVPIGLDLDEHLRIGPTQPEERQALGAGRDDVVVAFVGRLVHIKRVDILLAAVAEARRREPRLHLVVVGGGELRQDLEYQAANLGLAGHVTFTGFRDDLPRIAAGTDVAALTSDNEGTPVSLIEAGAAGRPSVATAVGGVTDIVRRETGITFPRGDVAALADALVELAGDSDLRTRLGQAAREHVRRTYAADRLIHDIEKLYDDLLLARAA